MSREVWGRLLKTTLSSAFINRGIVYCTSLLSGSAAVTANAMGLAPDGNPLYLAFL